MDNTTNTWTGSFHFSLYDKDSRKYDKAYLSITFDSNFNTNVKGSLTYTDLAGKNKTISLGTSSWKNIKDDYWLVKGGIKYEALNYAGPILGNGKHKGRTYKCDQPQIRYALEQA